jgi:membrane peptidoglycan carboxypeptidase
MFAWLSRDLPKPGKLFVGGFSTTILDRSGKSLYDFLIKSAVAPVTIDQMPIALRHATVAVEDKDFYKHSGVDLLTPIRIVYNVIFRQRVVGGSTLTQQLVKNVLLTNERSLTRKFKEFVLALQIERQFTKDQILEMYLNEAPYGGTAWGVAAAAQQYYGKPLSELTTLEAIILAGLPQRPSAYSPFLGKTDDDGELLWKVRTKGVLRRMQEDGYITNQEHDQYITELESVQFQKASFEISAPHFVFYVRDQLAQMYGEDVLEQGGLKVTTTLDSKLQENAETVVQEEIDKVKILISLMGRQLWIRSGEILTWLAVLITLVKKLTSV